MMFDGLGFIGAAGQPEAIDVTKRLFLCSILDRPHEPECKQGKPKPDERSENQTHVRCNFTIT